MPTVTAQDRIAAHRAQTTIAAHALDRLQAAGIAHEQIDGTCWLVAGSAKFWPATGYWRSGTAFGYGVGKLIFALAAQPAKPSLTVVSASRLPELT